LKHGVYKGWSIRRPSYSNPSPTLQNVARPVIVKYTCSVFVYARVTGDLRASANRARQQRWLGCTCLWSGRDSTAEHHVVPWWHTGSHCLSYFRSAVWRHWNR